MTKRIINNTTFKLLIGVIFGILLGYFSTENMMKGILSVKYIIGQIIFFMVPLIIFGFVTPSITKLKSNASNLLSFALILAYISTIGSALFALLVGYNIIPELNIAPINSAINKLPSLFFQLDIPPVISVMSALVLSIFLGLAVVWTKSDRISNALSEFHNIVLALVNKILGNYLRQYPK